MSVQIFSPAMTGGTVGLTAAITLASGAPTAGSATLSVGSLIVDSILVGNASTLASFVRISTTASLTATTVDVPIMPNTSRILAAPMTKNIFVYAVNGQTLASSATVYFTPGEGGEGQ